jgi:hypothetical protein
MAGTREGGLKAAQTIRNKNPNFYCENGRIGGKAKNPKKGFGSNKDIAKEMAERIRRKREQAK